jgi:hypothetical protein
MMPIMPRTKDSVLTADPQVDCQARLRLDGITVVNRRSHSLARKPRALFVASHTAFHHASEPNINIHQGSCRLLREELLIVLTVRIRIDVTHFVKYGQDSSELLIGIEQIARLRAGSLPKERSPTLLPQHAPRASEWQPCTRFKILPFEHSRNENPVQAADSDPVRNSPY